MTKHNLKEIGWREYAALPDLSITLIKAKVDTGARTSALDVKDIEPFTRDGVEYVRFTLATRKKITKQHDDIIAPVLDRRSVKDSGGKAQSRFVISTPLVLGDDVRMIELTLARRPKMRFPMLIGRTAIRGDYVVNPDRTYLLGRPNLP